MNETTMTVSGNLVSDVELRTTAGGDALARFRVACTVKRYDRATGNWVDADTAYWNVAAWRRAALNASQSLAKGHPVVVHGRVRQRTVDRPVDGGSRTTIPVTYTDLEATSFGLDLSRCQSVYQRAPIGPQTSSTPQTSAPTSAGPASGAGDSSPPGVGVAERADSDAA